MIAVSMLPDLWKKNISHLDTRWFFGGTPWHRPLQGPFRPHLCGLRCFHFRWRPKTGNGERKPTVSHQTGSWEKHRFKGFPSCYMILVGLNFNLFFFPFFKSPAAQLFISASRCVSAKMATFWRSNCQRICHGEVDPLLLDGTNHPSTCNTGSCLQTFRLDMDYKQKHLAHWKFLLVGNCHKCLLLLGKTVQPSNPCTKHPQQKKSRRGKGYNSREFPPYQEGSALRNKCFDLPHHIQRSWYHCKRRSRFHVHWSAWVSLSAHASHQSNSLGRSTHPQFQFLCRGKLYLSWPIHLEIEIEWNWSVFSLCM